MMSDNVYNISILHKLRTVESTRFLFSLGRRYAISAYRLFLGSKTHDSVGQDLIENDKQILGHGDLMKILVLAKAP